MKSPAIVWLAVATLAQLGHSQKIFLGSCPNHPVVTTFDAAKYSGTWYEHEKYFAVFEFGQRCVTATYQPQSGGEVSVLNRAVQKLTGKPVSVSGTARPLDGTNGKLGVTFSSIPFAPRDAPYWVLDTDYTSYSLVWSCTNKGLINTQITWILTRDRSPAASVLQIAYNKMDALKIPRRYLIATDQTNCPNV